MKPDFALSLSDDGISLLNRAGSEWVEVGSVRLEDPELDGKIAELRTRAEKMGAADFPTKLVVPNDYVLYLSTELSEHRTDTVLTAVRNQSSIPLEEAVVDWCISGPSIQIAVINRTILEEAEAFALNHGFNPVSLTSIPQAHQFSTEPYFGTTKHAAHLASDPEFVGRDAHAMFVRKEPKPPVKKPSPAAKQKVEAPTRSTFPWIALAGGGIAVALLILLFAGSGDETEQTTPEIVIADTAVEEVVPPDQPIIETPLDPAAEDVAAIEETTLAETVIRSAGNEHIGAGPSISPIETTPVEDQVQEGLELITESDETQTSEPVTEVADAQPDPISDTEVESPETFEDSTIDIADPPEEPEPDLPPNVAEMIPEDIFDMTGAWTESPANYTAPRPGVIYDLRIPGIDSEPINHDAIALSDARWEYAQSPIAPPQPAPAETTYQLDANGLVVPTEDGAMTPDGVLVYSGSPPIKPDNRPQGLVDVDPATDPDYLAQLATIRPKPRPEDLQERHERANYGGLTLAELADRRPNPRPPSPQDNPEIGPEPTDQAVMTSVRPTLRAEDFYNEVVIPVLAAREPAPEEPSGGGGGAIARGQGPQIPTSASVAREATQENMVRLNRLILIGIQGASGERTAVVRTASGRFRTVGEGERLDGGRVIAINATELIYEKNGRNITLTMPPT